MKFFITIICHFLVQSKYILSTDRQQQDIIFIQKRNEMLIV